MKSSKIIKHAPRFFLKYPKRSVDLIKTAVSIYHRNRLFKKGDLDNIPFPRYISIKLTNKCDLRCRMCMQWGDNGIHKSYSPEEQKNEMDWDILRKLLYDVKDYKPTILLWGGEPLTYSKFNDLLLLLNDLELPFDICTNGIQLSKYMTTLLSLKNNFSILVSIDGVDEVHDKVRGKDAFKRTMKGVLQILEENSRRGPFNKIMLGIETTVVSENSKSLVNTIRYFEKYDIAWFVVNMQWIINKNLGEAYQNDIIERIFNKVDGYEYPKVWSWNGFVDSISPDEIESIANEIQIIQKTKWRIPVIFQPPLEGEEVKQFYNKVDMPVANRKECRVHWSRVEVYSDGSVYPCKPFPDVAVGNLNINSLFDIWNGDLFTHFRKEVREKLFPICAKCPMLYTYGK